MRILLILLFIPFISFSQSQKDKEYQRKTKLNITNRGLDLNAVFVPIARKSSEWYGGDASEIEVNWKNSLFEQGFEVGVYYTERTAKDANNREINLKNTTVIKGRYSFNINQGTITIEDSKDNFKTVATIRFKDKYNLIHNKTKKKQLDIRNYFIRKLIESNK